jgi:hypothetical protein
MRSEGVYAAEPAPFVAQDVDAGELDAAHLRQVGVVDADDREGVRDGLSDLGSGGDDTEGDEIAACEDRRWSFRR